MGNAELQELVKAYAEGNITFSDYREQRSELLDTVTGKIIINDESLDSISENDSAPDVEQNDAAEKEMDDKEDIISLANNRSPVAFLLIVTIVLLSFVYVLTII